jgi:uracil phosphoribosyltransferase
VPKKKFVKPENLTVISHPVILDMLTRMREAKTETATFWQALETISMLMCFEATKNLSLGTRQISTPLRRMNRAPTLAGKPPVFVSIWRAGDGMLGGMRKIIPSASVSHLGLYRNHDTFAAEEYYFKHPSDIAEREVIVLDPMLATGNSIVHALDKLVTLGAQSIRFVCLVSAPEGIKHLAEKHPRVPIFTAAIDSHLNEKNYIVPGLGDAGDRIFGTK